MKHRRTVANGGERVVRAEHIEALQDWFRREDLCQKYSFRSTKTYCSMQERDRSPFIDSICFQWETLWRREEESMIWVGFSKNFGQDSVVCRLVEVQKWA